MQQNSLQLLKRLSALNWNPENSYIFWYSEIWIQIL